MATAFYRTLARSQQKSAPSEEFEALKGILGAFAGQAHAGSCKALEPTLRHLLARVL